MTTAPTDPAPPRDGAVLATRILVWARNAMAVSLVVLAVADIWYLARRPTAPEVDPARPGAKPAPLPRPDPGDQTRPYDPGVFPTTPGGGPIVLPDGRPLAEPRAGRMTFTLHGEGDGLFLLANGRLEPGTAEEFRRALDAADPAPETLVLVSGGGAVAEALTMGDMVRAREMTTRVPEEGFCLSACPLVLAAGTTRLADEPAWVGLHQMAFAPGAPYPARADRAILDIQSLNGVIMDQLDDWGTDPAVWAKALNTPPEEIYYLTREEMTASGLVTADPPR